MNCSWTIFLHAKNANLTNLSVFKRAADCLSSVRSKASSDDLICSIDRLNVYVDVVEEYERDELQMTILNLTMQWNAAYGLKEYEKRHNTVGKMKRAQSEDRHYRDFDEGSKRCPSEPPAYSYITLQKSLKKVIYRSKRISSLDDQFKTSKVSPDRCCYQMRC